MVLERNTETSAAKADFHEFLTNPDLANAFGPSDDIISGYSPLPVWMRIRVRNRGSPHQNWVLVIDPPYILRADFFATDGDTGLTHDRWGSLVPTSEGRTRTRYAAFEFKLKPGESRDLYLRIESDQRISTQVMISSAEALQKRDRTLSFVLSLYFGVVIGLFFYNLAIYAVLRDVRYYHYLLWLFFVGAVFLVYTGSADYHLPSPTGGWMRYLPFLRATAIMVAFAFARSFLDTRELLPRWDRLLQVPQWTLAGLAMLSFTRHHAFVSLCTDVLLAAAVILFPISGILSWRRGFRPARYYLLSWLPLFITTPINLGAVFGQLPYNLWTTNAIVFGSGLEMILLSFALADRVHMETRKTIQARDDFLAAASHELRTPITPLKMHLDLMKRHMLPLTPDVFPNLEAFRKAMEDAERASDRIAHLVENLLDVSQIGAGQLVLNREEIDLSTLVSDVVKRFSSEAERAGCEIRMNLVTPASGFWDRMRIEQIVTNLLANAMKFGAGAPIEITTSLAEGEKARLSVRDHGIGIAREDQARIFWRFERKASIMKYSGLGLGLYIVREMVLAHGGMIFVDSELGKGSTFIVELPRWRLPRGDQ